MKLSRTVLTIVGPPLSATVTVEVGKPEEVIAELQQPRVPGRVVGKGSRNRVGRDASARHGDANGASPRGGRVAAGAASLCRPWRCSNFWLSERRWWRLEQV